MYYLYKKILYVFHTNKILFKIKTHLPIFSIVDSVISYVGINISTVSSLPHHENTGKGSVFLEMRGQSPRFITNSISGKTTFLVKNSNILSENILNPTCFP